MLNLRYIKDDVARFLRRVYLDLVNNIGSPLKYPMPVYFPRELYVYVHSIGAVVGGNIGSPLKYPIPIYFPRESYVYVYNRGTVVVCRWPGG